VATGVDMGRRKSEAERGQIGFFVEYNGYLLTSGEHGNWERWG
jgi:hypothetical protein